MMGTEDIATLRHSTSHVMAAAVKELYPEVKLGIGPSIADGFYYDFDRQEPFTSEDLEAIEKRMREIVGRKEKFVREEIDRQGAIELFGRLNEGYKVDLLRELPEEKVTLYRTGGFLDLCRGPHVESAAEIRAFKLLSVAGAYWRGDEQKPMLQRIYGTAFFTKKELDEHLIRLEEAKKRDHRKLGKQLDLFSFHEEGPGFPFYHPRGVIIYQTLLEFWREEHRKAGYEEVMTPIVLSDELWRRSGHYEHYRDHMYFTMIENRNFAIRPMNCPGALLIFKEKRHSYREFPIRTAELGLVHRHELSGVIHGLFRVKSFVIDDAHIFCLPEQLTDEICAVTRLILRIYLVMGFAEVRLGLSTRPEKSLGTDEMWEKATRALTESLERLKLDYKINEGEGAFYGPKIEFHITDCLGRSWQCGTVQVDFSMPERFELEYVGEDGQTHRPVMIHRAAFGSIERFLGILIEHYGGAFPAWLAPVQVKIMTVTEKQNDYARSVEARLLEEKIRVGTDLRNEKISYKIREAQMEKVPYMFIVGDRETAEKTVSLRLRRGGDQGAFSVEEVIRRINAEIKEKKNEG